MERLTKTYEDGTHGTADTLPCGENSWEFKGMLLEALGRYEDLGVTPEQIREIDRLYAEKCREVTELKARYEKLDDRNREYVAEIRSMEQELQDARKWTPVTERLPEKNEDVLVFYTNSEIQVDFIANDGDWFWEDREDGIEAIAWMPLPELYKPE